ncbi:MAG: 3-hydroxyacyl-CoA dehydrogenase [Alcaligenaceae bacterium]|nr:3-hydroxyacyl-CoA dehydrogenase [Alcaligenaceae bacterium]
MNYKKITTAGSGVLGYQVAFHVAFHGFKVSVYDINDEILDKAKAKFDVLSEAYTRDLQATPEQLQATKDNLTYTSDLALAVKDADLVIESVPENIKIKKEFYTKLAEVAPEKTIFATNSSTLLPSQFAQFTGRPEKFLALHFANNIWIRNIAEIMGHADTDKNVYNDVVDFAKAIGMLTVPIKKEQAGYVMNTLSGALLHAATDLLVNGVADPKTIDKTWMKTTGAPSGPCAFIDIVGMHTLYNVNKMLAEETGNPNRAKAAEYLKENFIDKGKLGTSTGEGFYTYPNPEFKHPDFLKH